MSPPCYIGCINHLFYFFHDDLKYSKLSKIELDKCK